MSRAVILHVVKDWVGGVPTSIVEYARATPEYEHHLLHAGSAGLNVVDSGTEVFASVRVTAPSLMSARAAVRAMCRDIRPDLVHAHSSFGGAYARLAFRSTPARRIVYTPHCFAFERRDIDTVRRAAFVVAEWLLARNVAAIAACSPREARLARRLRGRLPITVVPNVAPEADPAIRRSVRDGGVVAIGRLAKQKDPLYFRQVVARLRERDPGVSATWIGDGDPAVRAALEADGIAVTGWVSQKEAAARVAAASLYVHTALWEGYPLSILEAASLETPIVARFCPGLEGSPEEWMADSPADVAELAASVLSLPQTALANSAAWSRALAGNDRANQALELRKTYQP